VYLPLLVLGLPAVLTAGRAKQTLLAHTVILVVALGGSAIWLRGTFSMMILPMVPGTNLVDQAAYITAHPVAYAETIARSFWHYGDFYYQSLVGVLGWLNLYLPIVAYILPVAALLLSVLAQPVNAPRLPLYSVAWNVFLLASSIFLIMTALYLQLNQVGNWIILGIQGRYFLPLLPLFIATACSVVRLRPSRKASLVAFLVVTAIIAVQLLTADMAIVRAYQVF